MPQASGPLRPSAHLLLLSVKVTACSELVQGSSEKSTSHLSGTLFYLVCSRLISESAMLESVFFLSKQPRTRLQDVNSETQTGADLHLCILVRFHRGNKCVGKIC